ncbi:MAG: alpha/beta hydrolase fold domain-containing protein [Lachnospiraceae bacterium]|nr:alpha/beta hydrolase fold domain-containing protein [Lachnospiraceae bacterium]
MRSDHILLDNARKLRRNMTKEERHLWFDFLKPLPETIYRQKIIGRYIVDFYCAKSNIVIELDGSQHYDEEAQKKDKERDLYLEDLGITVLRYTNLEVDQNFRAVCEDILAHIRTDDEEEGAEDPVSDQEPKGKATEDTHPSANDISLRGKTARGIVKVANHLPVIGALRVNGDLQNLISEHEREWKFPENLVNTVIDQELYKMELLEKKEDTRPRGQRYVILQLHGGGYYGKLHNTYRAAAVYFHDISGGFDVLSPDYRVAPANPYPAALQDALGSYRWLMEQGYKPEHIIISGDSAGGGLTLALCMYLRDHRIAMPAGLITMSAWTDLTKSGDSYQDNYDSDPIFGGSKHTLVYKKGYYASHDPAKPYISPIFGVYNNFPPMLMQVGELEMLLDDTRSVAAKARTAGVRIREHVYPGMFHVFQLGLNTFPESEKAWEEIRHFLHIVTGEGFFD